MVIDYHAHLRGEKPICHHGQIAEVPVLHRMAEWTEPLLYRAVTHMAFNRRDRASLMLYRAFTDLGFNEVLRLFNQQRVQDLLLSMERAGIQETVICSIEPYFETTDLRQVLAPYRDRLHLFVSIDPENPGCLDRLETYAREGGVNGLKIHPCLSGPDPTSDLMFELVGVANRHKLPIFIHTGSFPFKAKRHDDHASLLRPVIQAYPQVPITLGHIGWDQCDTVLALGDRFANVSVETSWQPAHVVRRAVDRLGVERVLFGSDFPLFKQREAVQVVRQALSQEEWAFVSHRNARRLLRTNNT